MSAGLVMDPTFLPRSIWAGDGKFLQHPADLYSSGVVVTRGVPAGTCFGPCVLHNTFYDTIAFIAQKACDRRAKPYVFRVDPEAMRNSALVLSWLRLVQAARSREEQNTEAFLKAGQLYVRTTRDIRQEEELLVWYDRELSHLLGFTDTSEGPSEEFRCGRCDQVFKYEYPFLAHCRFLCTQAKSDAWSREAYAHKHAETKRQRRVTDFHNIARDLEHGRRSNEDAEVSPKRRKYEDATSHPRGRKTVLLEKTNISNDDNITQLVKGYEQAAGGASSSSSAGKLKTKPDHVGCKDDAFAEAGEAKETFTRGGEVDARPPAGGESSSGVRPSGGGSGSAFSPVLSGGQGEQKSAFCKPSKRTSPVDPQQARVSAAAAAPLSGRPEEMPDAFTCRTVVGYGSLMASGVLGGDLQPAPSPAAPGAHFHYAPEHWSRSAGAPQPPPPLQQQAAPTLAVLPPTFTSFGVSVQNWCAKCNLSFRMTSDLVFHMRSHHKKEFAAESQVRRRREEKLTCPICHEYFRERHHLSRHMTSHN